MKADKICSFFGHRDIDASEELCAKVRAAIEGAIARRCRIFYFGGFGDFDFLCHRIVTEIKDARPELCIQRLFVACTERDRRKPKPFMNKENYEDIICIPLTFDYWYTVIYYRNCAMIDESDEVIFYAEERQTSGAYKAYKYAKRQKDKRICNLF